MIERSRELPDDVDQLKSLALATAARADRFEVEAQANKTEAEAFRSEALRLKAEVSDLAQANAAATARSLD